MKTKKVWAFIGLLAFAFAMSFTVISCGDDNEEENGTENNEGTSNTGKVGGGCSADKVVGTYHAITGEGSTIMIQFLENGEGIVTEKYLDSSTGRTVVVYDSYTYSMAGSTGTFRKSNDYSGDGKAYTISFVDGFMFITEPDGDVEFILYKEGANLGKGDVSKFVGTWEQRDAYHYTKFIAKSNGTGTAYYEFTSNSYSDKAEIPFTFKAVNAYVASVTLTVDGEKETNYCGVFGGKLYLIEDDGEVDVDGILTKK